MYKHQEIPQIIVIKPVHTGNEPPEESESYIGGETGFPTNFPFSDTVEVIICFKGGIVFLCVTAKGKSRVFNLRQFGSTLINDCRFFQISDRFQTLLTLPHSWS